jgi:hypothetical protein
MRCIAVLLLAFMSAPVCAGDLWEVVSTSVGPDGSSVPNIQKSCLPKNAADPAQMLNDLGNCTFDERSGTASALTFVMTCKLPGMPADMGSMKVAGDAKLSSDKFDMRYTIEVGGDKNLPGSDFKMVGSLEAHKVGPCSER